MVLKAVCSLLCKEKMNALDVLPYLPLDSEKYKEIRQGKVYGVLKLLS